METQISSRTDKKSFRRCALLKIDLIGRIVNVDALVEQLLGLPSEELFGRDIAEFLDEESYAAVISVLNNRNRYESFYETTDLVFKDSQKNYIEYSSIISLNFIGGNPANYQIIINPFGNRISAAEPDNLEEIPRQIFNYLAALKGNIDWEELMHVFLKSDKIIQSSIYSAGDKMLDLIADVSQSDDTDMEADLCTSEARYLEVISSQQPLLNHTIEIPDTPENIETPECMESCYPLVNKNKCWGMIRFFHSGDIEQVDIDLNSLTGFLGNALYSFLFGDANKTNI